MHLAINLLASDFLVGTALGAAALFLGRRLYRRLQLSRAKHPSLTGHSKMSRRIARLLPFYEYGDSRAFSVDDAPAEVVALRRRSFDELAARLASKAPRTLQLSRDLEAKVSDVDFTNAYRVPFQFRALVRDRLPASLFLESTDAVRMTDLDGNEGFDLTGSYGVNVFGHEFYKDCLAQAVAAAAPLGPVLGRYHPVVRDNVCRLLEIAGQDEVSFHMSGTEAVMQAVRLARYHTKRTHLVRFCGAYHGWWDGVQPGVGNPRRVDDVYTLEELSDATLEVLRTRKDIACVLVNPLQALHPNKGAPSDSSLVSQRVGARADKETYGRWLRDLRAVCSERDIALIIDDVFLGFRVARGGTQEYYGVEADLVTYGKTLGGGLPIGVVCGKARWMKRFRDDRPTDICFARGTFQSHPYVMTAMNVFLRHLDEPAVRLHYASLEDTWARRVAMMNARMEEIDAPVRFANLLSVWTTLFVKPGRYHWLLQYYLRDAGLVTSWIGTGRFIFSHDYSDEDFEEVVVRMTAAVLAMQDGGWWWGDEQLTSKSIRRNLVREIVKARLQRTRSQTA